MPSTHVSLHYHLIFSTKERFPFIRSEWRARLHEYVGGCLKSLGGVPLKVGGVADHIHMLVGLKPTNALSDVLRDVKQMSSRWVHDTVRDEKFAWQEGYGAFTVSKSNCGAVAAYIEAQEQYHRRRTFQDEYLEFLKVHEVDFDERYLW